MLSLSSNVVTPWARQKCPHFLLSIWEECQTHHCQRDAPSDDKQIRCPSGLKKTAVYLSIFRSLQICWFPWPSKVMDRNTQNLPCGSGVQVELRSPFFKEGHPSSILFSILHIIQLYTSYIIIYIHIILHDMIWHLYILGFYLPIQNFRGNCTTGYWRGSILPILRSRSG